METPPVRRRSAITAIRSVVFFSTLFAATAFASPPSLVGTGWWDDSGKAGKSGRGFSYFCGVEENSADTLRNFFVFNVSGVQSSGVNLVGARLELFQNEEFYASTDPTETYVVHDVTTDTAALLDDKSGLHPEYYDDLGTGVLYGNAVASPAGEGTFLIVDLNASAVSDLWAAILADEPFAFGGSLSTLSGLDPEAIFDKSEGFSSDVLLSLSLCGDGQRDPGELCDDGNIALGDGCTDVCTCEATPDSDGDGVSDPCDVCPDDFDPGQEDADGDFIGDLCDNCVLGPNPGQEDTDGDGIADACDNCPDDGNVAQDNADGDTLGDVCDPCTNAGGTQWFTGKSRTRFTRVLNGVASDETFQFSGQFVLPPGSTFADVDPFDKQVRLGVSDANGDYIILKKFPSTIFHGGPGTSGWRANGKATKYTWRDKNEDPAFGIVTVRIDDRSKKAPGLVRMKVKAKKAWYHLRLFQSSQLPLKVEMSAGDSVTGECGESDYTVGECEANHLKDSISCSR